MHCTNEVFNLILIVVKTSIQLEGDALMLVLSIEVFSLKRSYKRDASSKHGNKEADGDGQKNINPASRNEKEQSSLSFRLLLASSADLFTKKEPCGCCSATAAARSNCINMLERGPLEPFRD